MMTRSCTESLIVVHDPVVRPDYGTIWYKYDIKHDLSLKLPSTLILALLAKADMVKINALTLSMEDQLSTELIPLLTWDISVIQFCLEYLLWHSYMPRAESKWQLKFTPSS